MSSLQTSHKERDLAEASSVSHPLPPAGEVRDEDFPWFDAKAVKMILSGKVDFKQILWERGLVPLEEGTADIETVSPIATGTCPETCKSINVWGLHEKATEQDLMSLCTPFGSVADIQLIKPQVMGEQGVATVTFEERSAAQLAQRSLHRTQLHDKVCQRGKFETFAFLLAIL
jgi:hypothetical protein